MTDKILDKIILILMVVFAIFIVLIYIEAITYEEINTGEKIPCYDKHDNVIQGQVCNKLVYKGIFVRFIEDNLGVDSG